MNWPAVVAVTAGLVSGYASHFVTQLYYKESLANVKLEWAAETATLAGAKAAAETRYRELEAEKVEARKELDDAHEARMRVLNARWDSAYDKLRVSYEASCSRAGQTTANSSAGGVGDGAADRDGFLHRVIERLDRRVVRPADYQAEQLQYLQGYVSTVCSTDSTP